MTSCLFGVCQSKSICDHAIRMFGLLHTSVFRSLRSVATDLGAVLTCYRRKKSTLGATSSQVLQ